MSDDDSLDLPNWAKKVILTVVLTLVVAVGVTILYALLLFCKFLTSYYA